MSDGYTTEVKKDDVFGLVAQWAEEHEVCTSVWSYDSFEMDEILAYLANRVCQMFRVEED